MKDFREFFEHKFQELYMKYSMSLWAVVIACLLDLYLCNRCQSPLMLWVRILLRARCITLCDKVCQWLATGRWSSPGTPVPSSNKTDGHNITEILLKVALRHHKPNHNQYINVGYHFLTDSWCLLNVETPNQPFIRMCWPSKRYVLYPTFPDWQYSIYKKSSIPIRISLIEASYM